MSLYELYNDARSPHRSRDSLVDFPPRTGVQSGSMREQTQDTPKLYRMSRATDLTLTIIWRTAVTIFTLWFLINVIAAGYELVL